MAERRQVTTPDAPAPGGTYSQAIVVGDLVWTAGVGPHDPVTGKVVGDDVATQTAQVMRNLAAILEAAGSSLGDVVKTTTHLASLERDFAAYDAVYREHIGTPFPVRTTVGSGLLGMLVEIDVVAVRS